MHFNGSRNVKKLERWVGEGLHYFSPSAPFLGGNYVLSCPEAEVFPAWVWNAGIVVPDDTGFNRNERRCTGGVTRG